MSHHERVTVSGTIADIFAHRFVLETTDGRLLADLTPKGAERVRLELGARVSISGEQKPSEIKVDSFTPEGGESIDLGGKPEGDNGDPASARQAAEKAGFAVLADPRRKPKHWEVLGRGSDGKLQELHVELDGTLRKTKDADPDKWPEHAAVKQA